MPLANRQLLLEFGAVKTNQPAKNADLWKELLEPDLFAGFRLHGTIKPETQRFIEHDAGQIVGQQNTRHLP